MQNLTHVLITGCRSAASVLGATTFGTSFLLLAAISTFNTNALAGGVDLAWDASVSPGVDGYILFRGTSSGNYSHSVDVGDQTSYSVTGLTGGVTYYFALKAYDLDESTTSGYSEEVNAAIPLALDAAFTATPTSGVAPLTVDFTDASTGTVSTYDWDFGDGASSTTASPSHSYTSPGTYTVTLTLTGPAGTDSEVKSTLVTVYEPGNIARVTAGQLVLYGFNEGSGETVRDISGVGTPLDLTILDPGAVTWLAGGGLSVDAATALVTSAPATLLRDALQASEALTLEAWVRPKDLMQSGPARIVALSQDGDSEGGNFVLGQSVGPNGASYVARLRTTVTDQYGKPAFYTPAASATLALTHVVYTRDPAGVTHLYLNGAEVSIGTRGGNVGNWGDYPLALANEPVLGRPWLGELRLVAIYERALSASEVSQNFAAGPDGLPRRTRCSCAEDAITNVEPSLAGAAAASLEIVIPLLIDDQ